MSLRSQALKVAWACYGLPYIWGGDDALRGFDCSGLVVEVLQSVGVLPEGDWTAQGLWERFEAHPIPEPAPGALVFWARADGSVRHVEIAIGDGLSIGASGGGSQVKTREDAIEHNALVKVRPIRGRGNVLGFLDPFPAEDWWG